MNNTNVKQKERTLSNPPKRCGIRKDFPKAISFYDVECFLKTINEELHKQGTSFEQVKRIYLAYPHKHPLLFPGYINKAEYVVKDFKAMMEKEVPHVQWKIADEICETVHLGRSEDQTSVHALRDRQIYEIYNFKQKNYSSFIKLSHQEKSFFVIVDTTIEQGTTAANLMSYIKYGADT